MHEPLRMSWAIDSKMLTGKIMSLLMGTKNEDFVLDQAPSVMIPIPVATPAFNMPTPMLPSQEIFLPRAAVLTLQMLTAETARIAVRVPGPKAIQKYRMLVDFTCEINDLFKTIETFSGEILQPAMASAWTRPDPYVDPELEYDTSTAIISCDGVIVHGTAVSVGTADSVHFHFDIRVNQITRPQAPVISSTSSPGDARAGDIRQFLDYDNMTRNVQSENERMPFTPADPSINDFEMPMEAVKEPSTRWATRKVDLDE
jgi:hypothetical protein